MKPIVKCSQKGLIFGTTSTILAHMV